MLVFIQLTTAGAEVGPFDIYSYTAPGPFIWRYASDRTTLVNGANFDMPDDIEIVRIQSSGLCDNYLDLEVVGTTTTTTTSSTSTTTTSTSSTSTTTTTTEILSYNYSGDVYACADCSFIGSTSSIQNAYQLTVDKWYYMNPAPGINYKIYITSFDGTGGYAPVHDIDPITEANSCIEVDCGTTTTTSTTSTTTSTTSTTTSTTSSTTTTTTTEAPLNVGNVTLQNASLKQIQVTSFQGHDISGMNSQLLACTSTTLYILPADNDSTGTLIIHCNGPVGLGSPDITVTDSNSNPQVQSYTGEADYTFTNVHIHDSTTVTIVFDGDESCP